ncbi:MAG: Ig-like domain-containing protein [Proteobacteria bacterium]|nr:Ig-like domain-containing protein [Pseudomonadota bacterium]
MRINRRTLRTLRALLLVLLVLSFVLSGCQSSDSDDDDNDDAPTTINPPGDASDDAGDDASDDASDDTGSATLEVRRVLPFSGATGVYRNVRILARFSEKLDAETLDTTAFSLVNDLGSVAGTVSGTGNTSLFSPATDLDASTSYTATLSTDIEDSDGNYLASDYSWSFTTGTGIDDVSPAVTLTHPGYGRTGISRNAPVYAVFTEPIDPTSLDSSSISLTENGSEVAGTVRAAGTTLIFTPDTELSAAVSCAAAVAASIKDMAGNSLDGQYSWDFTTGSGNDSTPPEVNWAIPFAGSDDVKLNAALVIGFSEFVDPASVNDDAIGLSSGGENVAGVTLAVGRNVLFLPASELTASTAYTLSISGTVRDPVGNTLTAASSWGFTTDSTVDAVAPSVVDTFPANAANDVSSGQVLIVVFSENMDFRSVNANGFLLVKTDDGSEVMGSISPVGSTAVFDPLEPLSGTTQYSATLKTIIEDAAGNPLAADYSWSFTTGAIIDDDTTAPTVVSKGPDDGEDDLATNASISIQFNEAVDPRTVTVKTFTLSASGDSTTIAGFVTATGRSAVFDPMSDLAANTEYTATVTTAIADAAGNNLEDNTSWSFTTGAAVDNVAPALSTLAPADQAGDFAANADIEIVFSEEIDASSLINLSFTMKRTSDNTVVPGTLTLVGNTLAFNPDQDLEYNTEFTITLSGELIDLAGNSLTLNESWTFTTEYRPSGIFGTAIFGTDVFE